MDDKEYDGRVQVLKDTLADIARIESSEKGIGAIPMRELLLEQAAECLNTAQNTLTVGSSLEFWLENFKSNLLRLSDFGPPKWLTPLEKPTSAIVVGAGPSITDEQIAALGNYRGTIIATNKSVSRLMAQDIIPHYVVTLHTTPDIATHFKTKELSKYMPPHGKNDIKKVFTTMLSPDTIDAARLALWGEEFWVNPSVPEDQVENVDYFMSRMTGLPTIETGGNAGIFALLCASTLGCDPIGMLGLEHSHKLDPKWTVEQSLGYHIEYSPSDDSVYAVTPTFQTYLDNLVKYWRSRQMQGKSIFNLSPFGALYTRRDIEKLPYRSVEDFVLWAR